MATDVVLIGPIRSGKSTLANLLADRLRVTRVSLDQHRWRYYGELGYDQGRARSIQASEGFAGLYRYRKPFEAEAVRRVLLEHKGCVFDFGAAHGVQEDPELFGVVQSALKLYPNVVLVLPSEDLDESVRILNERMGGLRSGGLDFVEHFVRHRSIHALAKLRVYTKGKSPAETADEVFRHIVRPRTSSRPPPAPTRRQLTPRSMETGLAGRQAGDPAAPTAEIDRTSYAQHLDLAALRVPGAFDYQRKLADARAQHRRREVERLRGLLDRSLPEASRRFVNDCLAEAEAVVQGALAQPLVPADDRARAAKLYGARLAPGATLADVLALDPRDGVLPFHDGSTLALLRSPEVPARVRAAQREAIHERFLRRPQRSRYPFLHDACVGYFVNVFESGGAVKERRDLRLVDGAVSQLPAHFVAMLGRSLGLAGAEVAALHFADNATIERVLPQPAKDLLLVAAHLASCLELLMVHTWRELPRRLLGDVLHFFAVPSLERLLPAPRKASVLDEGPLLELVPDAGRIVEDAMTLLYFDPNETGSHTDLPAEPNEIDLVRTLVGLVDTIWCEPRAPISTLLPPPPRRPADLPALSL